MDQSKWLNSRAKGLGGTDVAALSGVHPYSTPLDVYESKVNGAEIEENKFMKAGRLLEPAIVEFFEEETGFKTYKSKAPNRVHSEHKFFRGSVDRLFKNSDGEEGIFEAKSTQKFIQDDPEPYHVAQLQWYFGITGLKFGAIGYLVRGFDYKQFEIERDDEIVEALQDLALDFWTNNIEKRIAPDPETIEDVRKMFTQSNGKAIEASDQILDSYSDLKKLKDQKKSIDSQIKERESELILTLGENEIITFDDSPICTFRTQTRRSLDQKRLKEEAPDIYSRYVRETDSRVLRLK